MAITDFKEFNDDKKRLEKEISCAVTLAVSKAFREIYDKYRINPADIHISPDFTYFLSMGEMYPEKVLSGVEVKMSFEI